MKTSLALMAGCASLALSSPALAQRTSENLVTQAADAFGKTLGNERIGLYNNDDVRGFNPIDAGNVRIEGLYYDHLERVPSRLVDGSTVRVGVAAQGYAFPAPTGIVDYSLTLFDGKKSASFMLERGPFGGVAGNAEVRLPLIGPDFGLSAGFGFREQVRPEGGRNSFRSTGTTLAWRPYKGALIAAFAGSYTNRDDEAHATLYPDGDSLPPVLTRGAFIGQDWTDKNSTVITAGIIGKIPLSQWLIEAGFFSFSQKNRSNFADLLRGVRADGSVANRTVIADLGSRTESWSGETRVTRFWLDGPRQHRFVLSARGRIKDRLFGGTQRIDLGASTAFAPDKRPEPALARLPKDDDHVQQMNWGLAYGLKWQGLGALDLSVSRAEYTKTLDFADPTLAKIISKDNPILLTATGSVFLAPRLSVYAGYVRGLEEALIAPDIANNRSEAPPAIRTRQLDLGMRYAVSPRMTLVAGVFTVRKPYFNLDPALRYRMLGTVDNRGVELSLAGGVAPGVTLVAGSLFLDPSLSGEAVDTGLIGDRPVGSLTRRSIANLDWRFKGGTSPLSLDLALESLSGRMANARNLLVAPPRETVNLGARYRFKLAGHNVLFRGQALNLFNDYGWSVSSSGGFTYSTGRTVTGQIIVDI